MKTASLSALFLAATAFAQDPDLAAAERELNAMFERPGGTPISDEQKRNLGAFLERHAGQDLRQLSYAKALHLYLERDYDGAVSELDRFFARYARIANAEHSTMAGRIYLNAVSREGRKDAPDLGKLAAWGERMTRLYGDADMLARMARTVGPRLKDPAPFRVALARGVFQSDLADDRKDAFLRSLYAEAADASAKQTTDAPRAAPAGTGTPAPQDPGKGVRVGQKVENFPTELVLNAPEPFDLEKLRGKVVLLDFFATWCGPCRAGVAGLVELQKQNAEDLRVIAVTRFYGRGMDFSEPGAERPHGGKSVTELDRDRELAVNRAFLKAFAVDYPLVFAPLEVARDRFGVTGIPTAFVIGRDGTLLGRVTGSGPEQHRQLVELVDRARKQAP